MVLLRSLCIPVLPTDSSHTCHKIGVVYTKIRAYGIHSDVYERVEGTAEVGCAAWTIFDDGPPDREESCGVVVDMEKSDLLCLLLEHHDQGVHKFVSLGDVMYPQYIC